MSVVSGGECATIADDSPNSNSTPNTEPEPAREAGKTGMGECGRVAGWGVRKYNRQ